MNDPRHYGLPHENYRPHQLETIRMIERAGDADKRTVVAIEAPTGSGKTVLPRAMGEREVTMSLCRTKSLQVGNYQHGYGFDALFGRSNYPCIHPDGKLMDLSAGECLHAGNPYQCPERGQCVYLNVLSVVKISRRPSLNYALFLLSRWPKMDNVPEWLFLDECHQLSDIVLDHAGTTINNKTRNVWGLPRFPEVRGASLSGESPNSIALGWLSACVAHLRFVQRDLERAVKNLKRKQDAKRLRRCGNLIDKLEATHDALSREGDDWYIRSGRRGIAGNIDSPGFVCRPLTARHHAPRLFGFGMLWRAVLMSATIGSFETFMTELGINGALTHKVPNAWEPSTRTVRILDAPKMGYRSPLSAYDKQADVIADAINSVDNTWSGIIHTKSWKAARDLAGRLRKRGLGPRVWIYDRENGVSGSEVQIVAWKQRCQRVPGSLMVSPVFHEGYDGLDEKICIIAKTPFPFWGDDYERARARYDGKFYLQRTAWDMEQSLGRTRRGRPQDYDTNGQINGLVAIADANWSRCRKYLSQDLQDAIVKG